MEYSYDGITDTLTGWSQRTGIRYATLSYRLKIAGWDFARAVTEPVRRFTRIEEDGTKECTLCGIVKPLQDFYRCGKRRNGNAPLPECIACNAAKSKAYRRNLRERLIAHYSGGTNRCAICGEERIGALDLDHLDGGGNQERHRLGGTNAKLYSHLVRENFPPGYQVLCRNDNWLKYLASLG